VDEWVPLSRATVRQRLAVATVGIVPVLLLANVSVQTVLALRPELSGAGLVIALVGSAVLWCAIFVGLVLVFRPLPTANFAKREIRIRGRKLPFDEITVCLGEVVTATRSGRSVVALRFGRQQGLRASVILYAGTSPTLDVVARERLADVLRASNIQMPTSKYDPTGAFAHYNFPGYLTRDEAVEMALTPPKPGDPMPWQRGIEPPNEQPVSADS
jgi:hypothetical protein